MPHCRSGRPMNAQIRKTVTARAIAQPVPEDPVVASPHDRVDAETRQRRAPHARPDSRSERPSQVPLGGRAEVGRPRLTWPTRLPIGGAERGSAGLEGALRTRTLARCTRYSGLALRSLCGSASSAASCAASAIDAPCERAFDTLVARIGVDPMLTSPTPLSPLRRQAATPTMAQSWARRLNFWKFHPAPFIFGTRISVSISSAASDGLQETLVEVACGDLAGAVGALGDVRRAERQASLPEGRRPDRCGAMDPPIVPRWRTCGSPT